MTGRFRQEYRTLSDGEKERIEALKTAAEHIEALIVASRKEADAEVVGGGLRNGERQRCFALAMTALEESVMWAVKGISG